MSFHQISSDFFKKYYFLKKIKGSLFQGYLIKNKTGRNNTKQCQDLRPPFSKGTSSTKKLEEQTKSNLKTQGSLFQGYPIKTRNWKNKQKAISKLRIPCSKGTPLKQKTGRKNKKQSQNQGLPFPRVPH